MDNFFFSSNSQFPNNNDPSNTSISRFFYEMSNGQFRVTADILKDPGSQTPVRINIDPTDLSGGFSVANRRVLEKVKQLYDGQIDWSQYDKRKNHPNFASDNSTSSADLKPDYVIIVYRLKSDWRNPPHLGWPIPWLADGYSILDTDQPVTIQGTNSSSYSFDGAGFTFMTGAQQGMAHWKQLFIHELAHELFSSPHFSGQNGVIGKRFSVSSISSLVNYGEMTSSANAWESWYLGWLDLAPDKDIAKSSTTKTVTIRDFLSYKEPVRIAIPHTNPVQYLWVENRQMINIFDKRSLFLHNTHGQAIPEALPGLHMFISDLGPSRSNPDINLVWNKANSIRQLHGAGNFDYSSILYTIRETSFYGSYVSTLPLLQVPNPVSGASDNGWFIGNHDVSTAYNESILFYNPEANKPFGGRGFEGVPIIKKENSWTYGFYGAYDPNVPGSTSISFNQIGQGAGITHNTVIIPFQTYEANTFRLTPVYLNGLSVRIIAKRPDAGGKNAGEEYDIEISYTDTDIKNNQRFTGDIVLNNVDGAPSDYDINVKSNNTLTINKSGTPNRHTKTGANDFINPTVFTCATGSIFHQEANSTVSVQQASEFLVHSGAKVQLKDNAKFFLKEGSLLTLAAGSEFLLNSGAFLEMENTTVNLLSSNAGALTLNNGQIAIKTGGKLILGGTLSTSLTSQNQEIVVYNGGILEIGNSNVSNYRIVVKSGGTLVMPPNAVVSVTGNGRISVESGGFLCVSSTAQITLQDEVNVINLHTGSLLGVNTTAIPNPNYCLTSANAIAFTGNGKVNSGTLYIQNELFTVNSAFSSLIIKAGEAVTTARPQGPVIVNPNATLVLKAVEEVVLEGGFEVKAGAGLEIKKQ